MHATFLDPSGKAVRAAEKVISASKGIAGFRVPLAMNMEHGTYTVVVRDVATGITAKHSWTID